MPKSGVPSRARRKPQPSQPAELPNALEGQIHEICHDLGVQVKRMRQLHEQADELRTAMRQWAGQSNFRIDEFTK